MDTVSHFVSPVVYKVLFSGRTDKGSYYRTESYRVLDFRQVEAGE
jgi:hypothetical protein